jgi:peptidoglycan hydrolase-like protein with peptidoglycan-binding domain
VTAQHAATDASSATAATPAGPDETPAGPDETPRRPGRRRAAVIVVVLVLAAAGTAGALAVLRDRPVTPAAGNQPALGTAPITRGDVVDTKPVDGKLQYTDQRGVPAAADGVVTWTPAVGAVVTRGKPLLMIDNAPVVLLYGSLPLYRKLAPGVEGADVKQLEDNLKALGYAAGLTVDDEYTSATAGAVERWQEDAGLPETGSVDSGQVVFEPGELRISEVKVARGTRVGATAVALTVTGTQAIVHVDLDAASQNLVAMHQEVTVTLPGGGTAKGTVTSVGTVAQTDQDGNATIGVDITVAAKAEGRIDQLPVTVSLVSERAVDVLSVPIEALLGLREGGFGVEVVQDDGTTRIVAVKTGVYGGGRVEITGAGLREGMKVGVPVK